MQERARERYHTDPEFRAKSLGYSRTSTCVDCGKPTRTGHPRCGPCYRISKMSPGINPDNTLECTKCRETKSLDDFSYDERRPHRGMLSNVCSTCQSAQRREHRRLHDLECLHPGCERKVVTVRGVAVGKGYCGEHWREHRNGT